MQEEIVEEKKLTPKFMAGFSKSSAVSPFRVLNYDYGRRVSDEGVEGPRALIVPPEIMSKRKLSNKPAHKRSISDTASMMFKP